MTSEIPMLLRLFEHMVWADARVLERLRADDHTPRALKLFAHLLAAERVWLARLRGEDSSALEIWPDLAVEECAALAGHLRIELGALFASLSPSELGRLVLYQNSAGREFSTPVGEILIHLALHGAYHRGQIATRMRDAAAEPINTDYITFVRDTPSIPFPEASG
jgi:uncharacterized damage-inducible protein DinB